jgi:hypothetical protein
MSGGLWRVCLAFAVILGAWFARDQAYAMFTAQPPWDSQDAELPSLLSNALAGCILMIGWWAVWRTAVCWTPGRVGLTIFAAAAAAAATGALVLFDHLLFGRNNPYVDLWDLGGYCGACVWFVATAFIWRGAATGFVPTLPCPKCGYDLRGLHEARCPECGTVYTLEELVCPPQHRPPWPT